MKALVSRKRIQIQGVVQGVGFRPFVYRIAQRFDIRGYILNNSDGVVIEAEAEEGALQQFVAALTTESPTLAQIDAVEVFTIEPCGEDRFTIQQSVPIAGRFALVPPDVATCAVCLRISRLLDTGVMDIPSPTAPTAARGTRSSTMFPTIVQTPRWTLPMCAACLAEYHDLSNRRFHAEPNTCPDCGPGLALMTAEQLARGTPVEFAAGSHSHFILERTRHLLQQGEIIAIKGLGGFQLACDAANHRAVTLLRERKRRSGKAFAIMVRDLATAGRLCLVASADRTLLTSSRRPIVLLWRREGGRISDNVAPGNARLGVMLPYTPLHHLLFDDSSPDVLIMTSGNLSEEPIVSRNQEAWPRLKGLADYFLLHNREIHARTDDSVVQSFEGQEYPIRRSRGFVPEPVDLGMPVREFWRAAVN